MFNWARDDEMIETIDIFFRFGTEDTVSEKIWELEIKITPEVIQPPTTGKFFYVDFVPIHTYGLHTIKTKVQSKSEKEGEFASEEYNLYITLDEGQFGLFNKECPKDKC